jgi:hypothetical protein
VTSGTAGAVRRIAGAGVVARVKLPVVNSTARHRALTAVVALLVTGAVMTACSGGDDAPSAAVGSSSPASSSAAATPTSEPAAPTQSAVRPSARPPARTTRPGVPAVETASPSVAIRTLPPANVDAAVQISRNVVVTVSNIRTATVSGSGPGEIAGEAAIFAVGVRNQTTAAVDLGGFTVTASYGKDLPASPSNAAPAAALSGSLKPGGTAAGTYVFRMPASEIDSLKIEVSSNTSPNIVVFVR